MNTFLANNVATIILIALLALIGAFSDPVGPVGAAFILAAGALAFARRKRVPMVVAVIGAGLLGYALFGRGFAYVGVRPFFIGEALLAVALVTAILDRGPMTLFRHPLARLIALFMLVGVASAVPHFAAHGFDVLRDSVVWAYALFALTIAGFFEDRELPPEAIRLFRHFALWFPLAIIVLSLARALTPMGNVVLPGTGVPLLGFKAGDVAVHLSAVAAFGLLSLSNHGDVRRAGWQSWGIGWWLGWFVALLLTANRAGLLAATLSLLL
jgi:MprA protease rhombosortase-interaction domain-containing protein